MNASAPQPDPLDWLAAALESLDSEHLRRRLQTHAGAQGPTLTIEGRELVNFGSNDYLGLAADERLTAAAAEALPAAGWGAGASPLITGHAELHQKLETRLAEFEATEAALLFGSGFAANVGTIAALVGRGDAVFGDQFNHASLIDGCRLSRADVHIYRHADCDHLAELLSSAPTSGRRLIVTDSVFSMDGDLAPLVEIANLAERYGAMLLVDEAHATGVLGEHGRGLAELLGVEDRTHVRIGTLSKALGSIGGFVAGRQTLIDWLVNRARPYVFSTALPPVASAAALAALNIVQNEPHRRRQLVQRAADLRTRLAAQGWNVGRSASQIIPIVLGDAERTMRLSGMLRERGLLAPGIRPPSVPEGGSLLRISLSYAHTPEMLARLVEEMKSLDF